QSGIKYRSRIHSQEVLKHVTTEVLYSKVVVTSVYRKKPLVIEIFGGARETRFPVINDMDGRNEVQNNLLSIGSVEDADFVIFNGDMANSLLSEEQMFADYMDTAIERFASEKPMVYARGNHETRGPFAIAYPRYFPTPTGKLYF